MPTETHPLNIGLIGFGYAGQTFHAPLIQATAGLCLAAVASSQPDRVHAALGPQVRVCGVQALVEDAGLDVVVIAAPNDQHFALAERALRAGRHVVVDKPFTLDLPQAEALVALAEARGLLLSVFHNRRWDSDFLALRQVLASGRLGRPVELVSHFDRYRPVVRQRWREAASAGAGLWMDLGPHLLDQAVQLFGCPDEIDLKLARMRDGACSDDWFEAQLHWRAGPHAGLRARLHASSLAAIAGPRFVLHGTQGSWAVEGLDPQEDALKAGLRPTGCDDPAWGHDGRQASWVLAADGATAGSRDGLGQGRYPVYYAALRDALWGTAPCPVSAREAATVQALLDAGRLSAQLNRPVPGLGPPGAARQPIDMPSARGSISDRPGQ
jgi:predicted dehydrogenase